ncbi:hypothetical protein P3T76_015874 [Phytophthora citrophthora]|uniref:Uncharacterized protein n=1 Tax=Phytophthora citrophthora TaxID=4793 RepID=A0AAD9LAX0_9STRA|nr:hypothetical protein P3T76_015874 [Phytophthora citrophthora]
MMLAFQDAAKVQDGGVCADEDCNGQDKSRMFREQKDDQLLQFVLHNTCTSVSTALDKYDMIVKLPS